MPSFERTYEPATPSTPGQKIPIRPSRSGGRAENRRASVSPASQHKRDEQTTARWQPSHLDQRCQSVAAPAAAGAVATSARWRDGQPLRSAAPCVALWADTRVPLARDRIVSKFRGLTGNECKEFACGQEL